MLHRKRQRNPRIRKDVHIKTSSDQKKSTASQRLAKLRCFTKNKVGQKISPRRGTSESAGGGWLLPHSLQVCPHHLLCSLSWQKTPNSIQWKPQYSPHVSSTAVSWAASSSVFPRFDSFAGIAQALFLGEDGNPPILVCGSREINLEIMEKIASQSMPKIKMPSNSKEFPNRDPSLTPFFSYRSMMKNQQAFVTSAGRFIFDICELCFNPESNIFLEWARSTDNLTIRLPHSAVIFLVLVSTSKTLLTKFLFTTLVSSQKHPIETTNFNPLL
jgi:hypothetical protein